MKVYLYSQPKSRKILPSIELFGLPKSGKSTLFNSAEMNKKKKINFDSYSLTKKIILFASYLIKHPVSTFRLFYLMNTNWLYMKELLISDYIKIFLMRNSYLTAVLVKCALLEKEKNIKMIDEFIMQALFMIFHVPVSEKKISSALENLPISSQIIMLEEKRKLRYERWKKITKPARNIPVKYRMEWWGNMEKNYSLIKKIIDEKYETKKKINNSDNSWAIGLKMRLLQ